MSTQLRRTVIRPIPLPVALAAAAALVAAVASLAGFIPGLYRDRAVVIQQTHGYDAGNLIVAAVLGIGVIWSARGSTRGRLVVIGALACLVYSYVTYAFLIVLNPVSLLYIAVLSFAAWSVATGLLRFDASEFETTSRRPFLVRVTGLFLLVVAVLFAANWLRQIGAALMSGHLPADLAANGWPMNPVWVEDLGFALPLIGLGGVWLLARRQRGVEIALPVLVFMPLLAVTILSLTVSMALTGQTLDMGLVGIFGALGVVSAGLVVTWFRLPRRRIPEQTHVPNRPLRPSRIA